MDEMIVSIRGAIDSGFIYPAFMSVLCLPDICGYLDNPTHSSGRRYKQWISKYVLKNSNIMTATEAYALRCAVLHSGEVAMTQHNRQYQGIILDKFELFKDSALHMFRATGNTVNGVAVPNFVRLNTKRYCNEILKGVEEWEASTGKGLGDYEEAFQIKDGGHSFSL